MKAKQSETTYKRVRKPFVTGIDVYLWVKNKNRFIWIKHELVGAVK